MPLEEFCDRWLDAWTGNRPLTLIEFYDEDALYRDPSRPEGLRGRSQLLAYFSKLLEMNPDWVWERKELFPLASGFALRWRARVPVADRLIVLDGLDLVERKGGRIARNDVYFDPTPLRR